MVFAINPAAALPPVYGRAPRADIAPVSAVPPLGAVLGQSARFNTSRGSVDTAILRPWADRRSFRSELSSSASTALNDAPRGESIRPSNLALAADPGTWRVLLRAQADRRDVLKVLPPPTPSVANDTDADGVLDTRDLAPNYAATGSPRVFGYSSLAALVSTAAMATGQMVTFVA